MGWWRALYYLMRPLPLPSLHPPCHSQTFINSTETHQMLSVDGFTVNTGQRAELCALNFSPEVSFPYQHPHQPRAYVSVLTAKAPENGGLFPLEHLLLGPNGTWRKKKCQLPNSSLKTKPNLGKYNVLKKDCLLILDSCGMQAGRQNPLT